MREQGGVLLYFVSQDFFERQANAFRAPTTEEAVAAIPN
jgi:hypothetical protein